MNNTEKGLIFISNVTKAMEHEWFAEFSVRDKLDVEFILFNSKNSALQQHILNCGLPCKNYSLPSKYCIPFYILYFTFKLIFKRYHFVHCHLFEASLIGISAAKLARVKKRIHTRHHSDLHHVYFPAAIKYDRMVNYLSTHIVAVSSSVKRLLTEKEHVAKEKVTVIPHGIPLAFMHNPVPEENIHAMREKYKLTDYQPVIGVVSRFVEWKGIQYIIPAFKKLIGEYPQAKLVLANATGNYETELASLLNTLPPDSFVRIKFESDVTSLFKTFSVFVHTPVNSACEAFGQVYIEALSLDVPMVCTLSGIATDLIVNEKNALVAEFENADSIYFNLKKLLADKALCHALILQGKKDVSSFSFETKFNRLKTLYLN